MLDSEGRCIGLYIIYGWSSCVAKNPEYPKNILYFHENLVIAIHHRINICILIFVTLLSFTTGFLLFLFCIFHCIKLLQKMNPLGPDTNNFS